MKTTHHVLALLLAAAWPGAAWASWTLDFGVGGYCIEMEVGDDAAPVVGRVRFFAPGDSTGIPLRPQDVRVDAFDVDRRQLHLEHKGSGAGAPAFDLRVDGESGVLEIDGQQLPAPFDWQM
ncbi:hypothetical protein [Agrilutibacter solisilvae]|uniref:Uncharacterized protein n=1 Tax=Agrilutibacter solisilvae TaxID=2763317 RepID=A0A974XZG5_9GAMM|nr:hypothetical protein [Lysobacter solisilvae]QSX78612.1 hypothetical protein I8J32_001315 [Lysobacter solisilvae]